MSKIIALTSGDPNSISSLISLKSWLTLKDTNCIFIFCGSKQHIDEVISFFDLPIKTKTITKENLKDKEAIQYLFRSYFLIMNINDDIDFKLGFPKIYNVKYILNSIKQSLSLINESLVNAIVTNPVDKGLIDQYMVMHHNTRFLGHTEYLSQISNNKPTTMMLSTIQSKLKVVPITTHVAIKGVSNFLSTDLITKKTIDTSFFLKKYYKIDNPKIAMLALNPHAGDNGIMGNEEITIINPAIDKLRENNIHISNVMSADSFFTKNNLEYYDVVMGMYHDQVLTPFKLLYFDSGVNVTIGLDFIRTSPDHGVGFDIATTKKVSEKSLICALQKAYLLSINQI